jgi:hypothetical protein
MMGFGDGHRHRFSLGLIEQRDRYRLVPCDLLMRESLVG